MMKSATIVGVMIGVCLSVFFGLGAVLEISDHNYFLSIAAGALSVVFTLSSTIGIYKGYDPWNLFNRHSFRFGLED